MAIDLLNRLTKTQTNNTVQQAAEALKNADSAEAARILRSVYALKSGDVLQGELVSSDGKDISLLLGNAILLNAKMDKELSLTPGQIMSFTVSSNQNGKLALRPLFANTGMEQNAMKALEAANIPITDKTISLAEEMMRQGMAVNKQNLSAVYRQMGMYPDAEIMDLVMLHKMEIPVSDENLSMMRLYQTNRHYLFSDLQGLSGQLSDFLSEMIQTQPTDAVQNFIRGFLDIFQEPSDTVIQNQAAAVQNAENHQDAELQDMAEGLNIRKGTATQENMQIDVQNNVRNAAHFARYTTPDGEPELSTRKEAELLRLLQKDNIQTESGKDKLTQNLFSLLKEQFLMKPQEMQSSNYVKVFFERLNEQVDKLQNLIKNAGKENSALGKEVNTIKSNIQFMNLINEMYHYVQLPLKMNQEGANGDLYVYKRKQQKTGEDGKLTALLHLSMPVLGNMDVFLSLENQKLSTRFCMEKEEMIDFIEAHIDRLNERLMKRGYQVQTSVTAGNKEEETVIDTIMKTEPALKLFTSQSFDARC